MESWEIGRLAYAAGIKKEVDLSRAIAVAIAESGGNPKAHNSTPPDDSYGLWQINMLGGLGPARRKQFGLTSNDQLFDPATNAKAMVAISGGGKNWQLWSTYNGLRYHAAMPEARLAAVAITKGIVDAAEGAAETVTGTTDAVKEGVSVAVKAGQWLANRNNWFRIAKVGVGAALIVGGLQAVGKGYATKAIAPIVGAVAPVGKAAKAVGGIIKK